MERLPKELIIEICTYFSSEDLLQLIKVNKDGNELFKCDQTTIN